ncbi:MAG TPA: CBS domain-containing protein [Gaiellaceae bacterium]|nr:CBS domain-containing protein [Gaiellaceae bacterium]
MSLRDLTLVNASVPESATLAEASSALFAAQVPALAVLDASGRVVGVFSEGDLLRAVFPGYLAEVRHTAFLPDDAPSLDERARQARDTPVREFARSAEVLRVGDSQIHAAERFMHTGEEALPVVDGEQFVGMLSIAALCYARLDRLERPRSAQS